MYERFTDRARQVMALANQEAQRFNHEYIGTEHILLGLVKERAGIGANALKHMGVDLKQVGRDVEKLIKAGPRKTGMDKHPQTPRAKKAIEYAIAWAGQLDHRYIGTEHLLMGLLQATEGVAAHVLNEHRVTLERAAEQIREMPGAGSAGASVEADPTEELAHTETLAEALEGAARGAGALRHDRVSTGHVLMALLQTPDGVAAKALSDLGVDPVKLTEAVTRLMAEERPEP